jgi:hypothetical protein|nr:MAG TPA: hypothetical protein [Caudoviricetes sp.]
MKEIVLKIPKKLDDYRINIEKKIHKEKNQVFNKTNYSNMSKYLSFKSRVK